MSNNAFQFAIEDGSVVCVEYKPSVHRLDKNIAKEKIVEFLQMYGCPGKTIEIFNTNINGEYRILIKSGVNKEEEIFVGIGNTQTGGKTRPIDEHRIQMSGEVYNDLYLKKNAGKRAVLLGVYYWNSQTMLSKANNSYNGQYVVCAWEPTATESTSPLSKQIKVTAISKAIRTGFAQYKGGVVACAFRPEFIYFYLDNSEWLTKSDIKNLPPVDETIPIDVVELPKSEQEPAENILFYGVPGAGKSFYIEDQVIPFGGERERVVFHPDYTYSDFIGQIMPRLTKRIENGIEVERLIYKFTPGPFAKVLRNAITYPEKNYYLVIEELNRGNAPAIFGEVFQLLDRTDSGESKYGINNFEIAEYVYGDEDHEIKIPSNLWILATMNTSDQNVFTLDTAFQRRWIMKNIPNSFDGEYHFNKKIEGSSISWKAFAEVINDSIVDASEGISSSEDKRLGAFFVTERELRADRFPEKVLKYLWDDAFRMERDYIFLSDMKSLDMVITTFEHPSGDALKSVLREDIYAKMIAKMKVKTEDEDSSIAE